VLVSLRNERAGGVLLLHQSSSDPTGVKTAPGPVLCFRAGVENKASESVQAALSRARRVLAIMHDRLHLVIDETYRLFHSTGPNKRQAHAMDYGYTKQKRFRITSVRAQTKLRFRFALHLAEAFLDGHGGRTICAVSSDVRFRNPDSNPSFV
jgi:hypothetical protein